MAVKNFEYYFAQLRRIEDHREAKAEKAIRKMYSGMLKELQQFVAEEYVNLAEDGQLTYEILRSKGQEARFLQEVEDKLSGLSADVSKEIRNTVEEVYTLAYDGLRNAVNKAKDTEELRQVLQGMDTQTAQTMWATVDNTIMDVALDKNHRENVWNIKRAVSTALREGDRFETMARRMEQELGYTHRKAMLITRTEVHRVREAGHLASAQVLNDDLKKGKSGYRMVKKWMTMKDERVRPNHWYKTKKGWKKSKRPSSANHEKMHGVIVEEDELFDLGGGVMTTAPGQSGVAGHDCNCRCQCLHLHMDDAEFFKATGRHFKDYEPEPEGLTEAEEKEFAALRKKYPKKSDVMLFGEFDEALRYDELLKKEEKSIKPTDFKKLFERQEVAENALKSWRTLPDKDEADAISSYCRNGYLNINNSLRFGHKKQPGTAQSIDALTKYLDENTVQNDLYLKRGISLPSVDKMLGEGWNKNLDAAKGIVFTDKGFVSTSPYKSGGFGGNAVMYIKAGKGTKGAYLQDYAAAKDEKEFLLQRDQTFIVRSIDVTYDKWNEPWYSFNVEVLNG